MGLDEGAKRCRDCGEVKPLDAFSPSKKNKDGRTSYCKPCFRVRHQRYRDERAVAAGRVPPARRVLAPGTAYCRDCDQVKSLAEFGTRTGARSGRLAYCRSCHNVRKDESRKRVHGGSRAYHLKRRYGITEVEYDEMVQAQGGLCAVCRERPVQHVDHDHVTGRVRGVLCFCCNQGLGNFRDRADIMSAAIEYLQKTTWQRTRICTGVYRLTPPRSDPPARSHFT